MPSTCDVPLDVRVTSNGKFPLDSYGSAPIDACARCERRTECRPRPPAKRPSRADEHASARACNTRRYLRSDWRDPVRRVLDAHGSEKSPMGSTGAKTEKVEDDLERSRQTYGAKPSQTCRARLSEPRRQHGSRRKEKGRREEARHQEEGRCEEEGRSQAETRHEEGCG